MKFSYEKLNRLEFKEKSLHPLVNKKHESSKTGYFWNKHMNFETQDDISKEIDLRHSQ